MSPATLAVKLRQARGAMTLGEAARRSGVSEQRIRMYEEGERAPYSKTLRKLAQAYGVPAASLAESGTPSPRRGTAPRVRRRRRRIRGGAGGDLGNALEVPVEVSEGQTVRLVIELIIRPANRERASTQSAAGASADGGASTGSERGGSPEAAAGSAVAGGRGPGGPEASAAGKAASLARPAATASGPASRPAPETKRARQPSGVPSDDAPDPFAEFRRAYTEFRREKK